MIVAVERAESSAEMVDIAAAIIAAMSNPGRPIGMCSTMNATSCGRSRKLMGTQTRPVPGTACSSSTSRAGRWTRARFEAARKHWAEHERWFSVCNREFKSLRKPGQPMSYDRRPHYLEDCMRRKH